MSSFYVSDDRENPPRITNAEGKRVPTFFMDFDGRQVKVFYKLEMTDKMYACPRSCGTMNTVELNTEKGIWLYCFDCGIFFPEYGNWGYKKC